MSKTAPLKKKAGAQSSTDSSSVSSSGSSSSSTSSSGSDSSSSSDSDSSSSQQSSKANSSNEQKKPILLTKTQRKSSDSSTKHPPANRCNTESKQKVNVPPKVVQKSAKSEVYSSDEGINVKPKVIQTKRKSLPKPKTISTVASKITNKPPINKVLQKNITSNKGGKNPVANKDAPVKSPSKPLKQSSAKTDTKKKSIFSPENSSESEDVDSSNKNEKVPSKSTTLKPRPKATAKAIDKPKPQEKPKVEKQITKAKSVISSASSVSSSTDSSSSSDSDTSEESIDTVKSQKKKPIKKSAPKETNTDSEPEIINKQVTRKLTRSASTRKSKHVLGKNVYTDTDSDTESTKRSLSRSPVKRGAITTKGKTKNNKRPEIKPRSNEIVLEERKCPVEGCNSVGHLSGKYDTHFTVDACPEYHNFTSVQCKDLLIERKKREEFRKRAMDMYKKSPRSLPTPEHKQYLQKIKDLRSKFKLEDIDEKPSVDKNHEPILTNFVPDYDLKLFRDAQAISSEKIEDDLKTQPNTKGTKFIEMGKFEMEVWYQSPYPEDFARLPKLYICEFCLRYMKSKTILQRHIVKCVWRHPPGEEVYRKDKISVWEVDGKRYKQYCQNLCLLAKFFLDHKTLYYDVEPFLFYVMTMYDGEGCHTVGYFSKEKNSFLNYNVSCILTLPPYQRQGYGRLLIDFSYLLTRVEGKVGSPEKPLSDLGLISYRSYWKDVLLGYICYRAGTTLSVKDISQEMAIHSYDIVSTLQALGMMKYWKGKHIILKKQDVLDEYLERVKRRGSLLKQIDPDCLRWKPFVPAQPNPT